MDLWDEFESKNFFKNDDYWEEGIAISELCSTAVPLDKIKQMIHEGFYDFVRKPEFILKQVARILKSSYRRKVLLSNLSRIREIRENMRSIA
jgi:hypothetical protein